MKYTKMAACAVAGALLIGLLGCSGERAAEKEVLRPVRYTTASETDPKVERRFSGLTRSGSVVRLSFRKGGEVASIRVFVGDRVKKGELVATLDDKDAQLNLDKARAALNKSRIQSENARSSLARVKSLYENNNVSLSEYEKARDTFANALATYQADERSYRLQERELAYYKLTSPIDGIITSRKVEANENVSSGAEVAVVQAGDSIEVEAGIPEVWISKVHEGQRVKLSYPSIEGETFEGRVTEVAFESDSQTHTYPVTLVMEGGSSDIRPGMPASVTFDFGRDLPKETLRVPVSAMAKDYDGHYLFVLERSPEKGVGVVKKRRVKAGGMNSGGFDVTEGLSAGEKVVTAGLQFLSDGMRVKVLAE
ncbi:MAG: efflux RND transporter periplasmic adaptor subunit [Desulfobacterales bacterium]|nr:efflux RND transporter periplasmic adaptor subunit [Desulfobacterales bacterium]